MAAEDFRPESIASTAFFTGHRILGRDELVLLPEALFRCLQEAYTDGYRRFFCGCALGFDTLAAFQVIRLRETYQDVRLSLAIPCATQADRWTEKDRSVYGRILDLADDRTVLSPEYYQGAMMTRNRYMADRSSLCVCYLKQMRGGTASTVRYALQRDGIRIVNLAVPETPDSNLLRENVWNCMFTSPSANRNAVTAPLRLIRGRKLILKNTPR
jgi:uncharacterized phage-like protein YoqJ